MRTVREANMALERQVWEYLKIDSMLARDLWSCLNLKNEWGHSKNPSLEAIGQRYSLQKTRGKEVRRRRLMMETARGTQGPRDIDIGAWSLRAKAQHKAKKELKP